MGPSPAPRTPRRPSLSCAGAHLPVAMIEGDPVDVALDWARTLQIPGQPPPLVPIVNMANDKRPGGDWEASSFSPLTRL